MTRSLHLSNPLDRKEYRDLPATNGIYIFRRGSEILYVGKSINIKARVLSHVEGAKTEEKEHAIVSQSNNLEIIPTDSEFNALILESSLIQKHNPKYNVIWKDDKSYLYIKITREEFPHVHAVRKEDDGKSKYFGPFSSVADVNDLLRLIRRAIPYCTQNKTGKTPCFYSKMNLCDPCPSAISKITDSALRSELKNKYRANIRRIISILKGNTDAVLKELYREMDEMVSSERYEEGIVLRNKIQTLEYLIRYRSFDRRLEQDYDTSKKSLEELKQILVRYFPHIGDLRRIECYDISNMNQKLATASMVVLNDGLVDKSQYRKFRIKNPLLQSDFDMLEEVITRRFRNKWPTPDLIVIDGGKPQVRRVSQVMQKIGNRTPVIGIAKRPDRFVIGIDHFPMVRPSLNNYGYRLVQLIRDESHRFARKYHLFLRNKKLL